MCVLPFVFRCMSSKFQLNWWLTFEVRYDNILVSRGESNGYQVDNGGTEILRKM